MQQPTVICQQETPLISIMLIKYQIIAIVSVPRLDSKRTDYEI